MATIKNYTIFDCPECSLQVIVISPVDSMDYADAEYKDLYVDGPKGLRRQPASESPRASARRESMECRDEYSAILPFIIHNTVTQKRNAE